VVHQAAAPAEDELAAMVAVVDDRAEVVGHAAVHAVEQRPGDDQVHRDGVGLRQVAVAAVHERLQPVLDSGEEVLVAAHERGRILVARRPQEHLERALVEPQVAHGDHVRVMDLGHGEQRAVEPAGARPGDDVDPRRGRGELEQPPVDVAVRADEPVELVRHAAHPDGEAHAAGHHDRKPQLLLLGIRNVAQRAAHARSSRPCPRAILFEPSRAV
jgi:hypothetical protein